jgi:fumarylacetoacetate (FAA) hydrolase
MKLATLKDGSRDGQLAVVSRDLTQVHFATGIATRLQQALDDWNFLSPQLEDLSATLNGGKARHAFTFDPRHCMAPLPRAFQRVEGAAYAPHRRRLGHATANADEPWLAQGASDALLGPTDDAFFWNAAQEIDFGAGLAVVTGDVPMGAAPAQALDGVRLLLLVNAWTLRRLQANGGDLQSRPLTAFGPVAVTVDELGDAWRGGRVHLPLQCGVNGHTLGRPDAGADMDASFGALLAALARHRALRAGSIVGGGTVSNDDPARGCACIAEIRALQAHDGGAARQPYLAWGDQVHIEMRGGDEAAGLSVFGAIEQRVIGPA